jgi:hypothetical protein
MSASEWQWASAISRQRRSAAPFVLLRVAGIEVKSVVFNVELWDVNRKIGDGTRRRCIINAIEFTASLA